MESPSPAIGAPDIITLALTCGRCHESAAVVTLPHPPALRIPDVLEFPVRAVVKFLGAKAPAIAVLFDHAQRGDWPAVIEDMSSAALTVGMNVLCEHCRRREGFRGATAVSDA